MAQQGKLLEKALSMMDHMDLPALPSLVYQMLLFTPKDKGKVVLLVAEFFEKRETKLRGGNAAKVEQLRQTEGTVLLHVDVALNQGTGLAVSLRERGEREREREREEREKRGR